MAALLKSFESAMTTQMNAAVAQVTERVSAIMAPTADRLSKLEASLAVLQQSKPKWTTMKVTGFFSVVKLGAASQSGCRQWRFHFTNTNRNRCATLAWFTFLPLFVHKSCCSMADLALNNFQLPYSVENKGGLEPVDPQLVSVRALIVACSFSWVAYRLASHGALTAGSSKHGVGVFGVQYNAQVQRWEPRQAQKRHYRATCKTPNRHRSSRKKPRGRPRQRRPQVDSKIIQHTI
jgi:hypothetical protein